MAGPSIATFSGSKNNLPRASSNKASVQAYRSVLIESGRSSSTVSLTMTALRRLAFEAADNDLLTSDLASSIMRVKGVKRHGLKIGTCLTLIQAGDLLRTPNPTTLKGKRNRALLSFLIGFAL